MAAVAHKKRKVEAKGMMGQKRGHQPTNRPFFTGT